ncbi:TIGR04197 family type VII secretion effector [Staphylococcus argensis]
MSHVMGQVKSDSGKTDDIFSGLKGALNGFEDLTKPTKDESTTVKGNSNVHDAIDNLMKKSKSVANAIEEASNHIKKTGESFEQTDQSISNNIGQN